MATRGPLISEIHDWDRRRTLLSVKAARTEGQTARGSEDMRQRSILLVESVWKLRTAAKLPGINHELSLRGLKPQWDVSSFIRMKDELRTSLAELTVVAPQPPLLKVLGRRSTPRFSSLNLFICR